MKIYSLLRLASSHRIPPAFKILGLLGMHLCGRRTIGIFMDPVLACNLKCRMCYFSDPDKRATLTPGSIANSRLDDIERALFRHAVKLQIGCGAEPTLYPHLAELISRARKAGIPYISLTTNGQLLASGRVDIMNLIESGLNEITLSMHGLRPDTYENLMPPAQFDRLTALISMLAKAKERYPSFRIRVNYTVNSMNLPDLKGDTFWHLWGTVTPDIVQLRPVQKLGETSWADFDLTPIRDSYDETIGNIVRGCKERGITCIAPSLDQLYSVNEEQDGTSSIIEDFTYCYISPDSCYKPDFDPAADTYTSYHKRHHTAWSLFKSAFHRHRSRMRDTSKKLNYGVRS
ncbi:MAG: radical SAM protein [Muribaculaceae bacterium]|nr:radical SAM protein [Muribaculaceae bacterium]